jgi:hypothetical protein
MIELVPQAQKCGAVVGQDPIDLQGGGRQRTTSAAGTVHCGRPVLGRPAH